MKTIEWTQFAPVGNAEERKSGTVEEFFSTGVCGVIAYFRVVPPLMVLNNFLQMGVSDHGMGGAWTWEPLTLSKEEYDELRSSLIATTPPNDMRAFQHLDDVPAWVEDESDFLAWLLYVPEEDYVSISMQRKLIQAEILREPNEKREAELEEKLKQLNAQIGALLHENARNRKCRMRPIHSPDGLTP
jgi:hypothetical protein